MMIADLEDNLGYWAIV